VKAIDFEEAAQDAPRVAAAKAIGSQGDETLSDIGADELGIGDNVVGRRDDGYGIAETASDMTFVWNLGRMPAVVSIGFPCVTRKLAETGDAPDVTGDLPLPCE